MFRERSEHFVPKGFDFLKNSSEHGFMVIKDYRKDLKARFLEKKKKNNNYSLRAFARDLNLSVTVLHGVLKEERHLSNKNLKTLADRLGWSPLEIQKCLGERQTVSDPTQAILFEDEFQLISDWTHLAVLNLAKIKNIQVHTISERLGIPQTQSNEIVDRLCRLDFIKIQDGVLHRNLKPFGTSQDIPSRAIRTFHYQNLENQIQ